MQTIPDGYRTLKVREKIRSGDQYFSTHSHDWVGVMDVQITEGFNDRVRKGETIIRRVKVKN